MACQASHASNADKGYWLQGTQVERTHQGNRQACGVIFLLTLMEWKQMCTTGC